MKKITATILKEWQLMKRDISGLLLLLVMPAALIIVMALIQDAPFKDYEEFRFDLLISDNDHGSLAHQITAGLKQSKNFHVIDSLNGKPVTDEQLMHLLNTGKYPIGITIPGGVTAEIVNSANIVVNEIAQKTGLDAHLPARDLRSQIYIHLYFDPVSKPAFRSAISLALDKYISYSCSNILMQRLSMLSKSPAPADDTANTDNLRKIMQGISVKEDPLNNNGPDVKHISSVQHNVPAWAIFGMFFIVIPIAGHSIKEREEGSALRISLIPGVGLHVALGKIILYTLVCTVQFMVMLAIGLWAMPLFHLPALYLGAHAFLLLPIALCIGFAATAYGFFIGTLFNTINQALPFGSVSIVILSAIGGIWVPIEILPHTLQKIAIVSPLHWSLEAVNQVMLRDGSAGSVLLPLLILVTTGLLFWIASTIIQSKRIYAK